MKSVSFYLIPVHGSKPKWKIPVPELRWKYGVHCDALAADGGSKFETRVFLHVTGHGNIKLSDVEVGKLREYLLRSGFLHVSDNYGIDSSFRREIARVFPDRPLVDVPLTHPIYHIVYDFPKGLPKVHEHDGLPARGFGIFLGDRLAVYYSFSSDLGNGWEDPEVYHDPPELHEAALRMGVNLFMYAVTSRPTP